MFVFVVFSFGFVRVKVLLNLLEWLLILNLFKLWIIFLFWFILFWWRWMGFLIFFFEFIFFKGSRGFDSFLNLLFINNILLSNNVVKFFIVGLFFIGGIFCCFEINKEGLKKNLLNE